jgi:hypothetical protein
VSIAVHDEKESDIVEKSLFSLSGTFPSSSEVSGQAFISLECGLFYAVFQGLSNEQTFVTVQDFYNGAASELTSEGNMRST